MSDPRFENAAPVTAALLLVLLASLVRGAVGGPLPPAVSAADCGGGDRVASSVFLVGDAGDPETPDSGRPLLPDDVLSRLAPAVAARAEEAGADRTWVIYLGDNVYPLGLPPPGHPGRPRAERVLRWLVRAAQPARAVFTAGNRDWGREGPNGFAHALEQRRFLAAMGPRVAMLPPGGCAGPASLDLDSHLRLVFFDLLGLRDAIREPQHQRSGCEHRTASAVWNALRSELERVHGRHLVLMGHHPLITGADGLYGEVMPGVLELMANQRPDLVVGGHEHNLQLHRDSEGTWYAVSGAGSRNKVAPVIERDSLRAGLARAGWLRLDSYPNGALGLTVFALDDASQARPVHAVCIVEASR